MSFSTKIDKTVNTGWRLKSPRPAVFFLPLRQDSASAFLLLILSQINGEKIKMKSQEKILDIYKIYVIISSVAGFAKVYPVRK